MTPTEALLDSWNRQCRIVDNMARIVTPDLLDAKPSEDGWTVAFHLAHIHGTRRYWHMNAAGLDAPVGPSLYTFTEGQDPVPSRDIEEIRARLAESAKLVHDWVAEQVGSGAQKVGNYDHPVYYLQHMVWHEGWHVALLMLAFRLAGQEPDEEWECANVWDLWRLPD
ncbi:MAG: DinB family protein [Armatimonadetes bacterium]|nr:DinB family protein [Armatimonadota bacterium]